MNKQIFHDTAKDLSFKPNWMFNRFLIYGVLMIWAFICLFPIYWTITTTFKAAPDVMKGNIVPWWDFRPKWLGLKSLGLSPNTLFVENTVREEFLKRFWNSTIIAFSSSAIAVALGSCTAYGLSRFSYRFGFMRNSDISFFFLSQLILPPVVLALPFLVLYKELALLDTRIGLIALYTLTVLPIVIWIMRDQFGSIPVELEEAALVDGLSLWKAFITIILPIALPGIIAAFIISLVLTWNEYFFAALLTSSHAKTLPVMVASQTGSQGIAWWSMAALSFAAILPLVIIGIILEKFIIKGMAAGAVK